jgi:glutathione S-transferase
LPESGFAVGATLSVADVSIGAQLITYRQGAGELNPAHWPKLARYLQSLLARPHWARLLEEEESALQAARERRSGAAAR